MTYLRTLLASLCLAVVLPVVQVVAQQTVPRLTPVWVRLGDADGVIDQKVNRPTSVESAEFSPDETRIASVAKGDDSIRLWNAADGSAIWTVYAEDETEAITFTRDGRYIVTGGEDRIVRVLQVDDGTVVKRLPHVASIEGLGFSHDGTHLATGNEAGEINVWDTSDPDPANWPETPAATAIQGPDQDHPTTPGPAGVHADINQVDWTVDDRYLVSAGRNAVVKLWDVAALDGTETGGLVRSFTGHHDSIKSTRLSPGDTLVAAGAQHSPTGAARVWRVATGELVAELVHANIRIMETVEFTPDGRYLLIGGTEFDEAGLGRMYVYHVADFATDTSPLPVITVDVFNQEYFHFSKDGTRLVSSHADGSLRLWRVEEGEHPVLNTLTPHPRLLFTPEREAYVRETAASDTLLQAILDVIQQYAEAALDEPVVSYTFDEPNNPPQTRRLKAQRRASMLRVMNLALTYRMTGDTRYAERAKEDLLAAATFPDWWPPHFLNVGEFAATVALGYDWLYDYLTDAERATIRTGLVENGLQAGLEAYAGAGFGGWRTASNNWNQVCNGGLVLAALAVAEDRPVTAQAVLDRAMASLPHAMQSYLPDGAWEEGPTYWAYGTTYNALLLDALATATGSLHGLDTVAGYPELGRSGLFHVQTVGPTNLYFNYGDAKRIAFFSPVLFWMAHHYDEPVYGWYERELIRKDLARMQSGALMQEDTLDRFLALLAVWYTDAGHDLSYDDLPYDTHFEGAAAVGAMRSGWTDDALYLGFKGGDNQAHHGHLDIGSFVLDAEGIRWALDLGSDSYSLPGYFDFSGPRWRYFRLNNHGHNTLVLNDDLQQIHATAGLARFVSTPDLAYAVVDMSAAYADYAWPVRRGFALLDRTRVLVQDEVLPYDSGLKIRWGMVTGAAVTINGTSATLTQDGKALRADILEPPNAVFTLRSTVPGDAREEDNTGTAMLTITHFFPSREPVGVTVLLTPVNEATAGLPVPSFRPLNPTGTNTEASALPTSFVLHGAYPNPFNPATTIRFDLPEAGRVYVEVFDMLGRKVRTIPERAYASGAGQSIRLEAATLAAGVYLYRLVARGTARTYTATGQFVLLS